MIRKAVGAIITCEDEILIVHKVKMMDSLDGPEDTEGHWDFPKGGVKGSDSDLEQALMRELKEETGSDHYIIKEKFDQTITFTFPSFLQTKLGYESQETTIFLVKYTGDKSDLQPQDEEIDNVIFVSRDRILDMVYHKESREFILKYVL